MSSDDDYIWSIRLKVNHWRLWQKLICVYTEFNMHSTALLCTIDGLELHRDTMNYSPGSEFLDRQLMSDSVNVSILHMR